ARLWFSGPRLGLARQKADSVGKQPDLQLAPREASLDQPIPTTGLLPSKPARNPSRERPQDVGHAIGLDVAPEDDAGTPGAPATGGELPTRPVVNGDGPLAGGAAECAPARAAHGPGETSRAARAIERCCVASEIEHEEIPRIRDILDDEGRDASRPGIRVDG